MAPILIRLPCLPLSTHHQRTPREPIPIHTPQLYTFYLYVRSKYSQSFHIDRTTTQTRPSLPSQRTSLPPPGGRRAMVPWLGRAWAPSRRTWVMPRTASWASTANPSTSSFIRLYLPLLLPSAFCSIHPPPHLLPLLLLLLRLLLLLLPRSIVHIYIYIVPSQSSGDSLLSRPSSFHLDHLLFTSLSLPTDFPPD